MQGQIGFEELEIETTIGVHDHERIKPRQIFLDLKMECDLARSVQTDNLQETIDYGAVIEYLRLRCKEKSFFLIESLASSICDDLLSKFSAKSVAVRVKKPLSGYPVKWAICELSRSRGAK